MTTPCHLGPAKTFLPTHAEYDRYIQQGQLPVYRGIELNEDDKIRRSVINRLICDFALDITAVEKQHNIDFADYFHETFAQLEQFAQDGLLQYNGKHIEVLPAGRLLIRNICMVFDKYRQQQTPQRFSKVI